jgi:NOL1/NOP2/sun family putative RNA methylase
MPERIPDSDKIEIKDGFKDRYSKLTDWDSFKEYSLSFLRRSIRINTLKISIDNLKKRLKDWGLAPIPWCKEGFWIKHKEGRRDIGNTLEHSMGYIYVQEAASMIPPIVLDPKPGEAILDMCASPGSKASQIGQYMENKGVLVANDFKGIRLSPLGINLQRCGVTNNIITLMKGEYIKGVEFDRILVDAPCSGTGTIRKSLKTLKIWNPNMVKKIAGQQRRLIANAFSLLKKGGTMVYSTCSLEPEENEGIIDWFLEQNPDAKVEEIKLDIKRSEPVTEFEGKQYNPEVKKTLRIWPQDNDTEGFFVAKIVKE